MVSNDFILFFSLDFEVLETEDYELEVEGSLNSSFIASKLWGRYVRGMCRRFEMEVKGYGFKI